MKKLRDIKPVRGTLHKHATPTGIEVSVHVAGKELPARTTTKSKKPLAGALSLPVQLKIGKKKYESMLVFDPTSKPYISIGDESKSHDEDKIHKALKHFDLSRTVTLRMRIKLRKGKPKKRPAKPSDEQQG